MLSHTVFHMPMKEWNGMENTLFKVHSCKLFLCVCLNKQEPLHFPSGSLKDLKCTWK